MPFLVALPFLPILYLEPRGKKDSQEGYEQQKKARDGSRRSGGALTHVVGDLRANTEGREKKLFRASEAKTAKWKRM